MSGARVTSSRGGSSSDPAAPVKRSETPWRPTAPRLLPVAVPAPAISPNSRRQALAWVCPIFRASSGRVTRCPKKRIQQPSRAREEAGSSPPNEPASSRARLVCNHCPQIWAHPLALPHPPGWTESSRTNNKGYDGFSRRISPHFSQCEPRPRGRGRLAKELRRFVPAWLLARRELLLVIELAPTAVPPLPYGRGSETL